MVQIKFMFHLIGLMNKYLKNKSKIYDERFY